MLLRLWCLFVLVPTVELGLLIAIGRALGLGPALGIILLTGTAGAWLARHQGADALRRIRQAMNAGRMPASELADGAMIFAAGLLLLTPGVLTDALGFTLLIPPCRNRMRTWLMNAARRHLHSHVVIHSPGGTDRTPTDAHVIEPDDFRAAPEDHS